MLVAIALKTTPKSSARSKLEPTLRSKAGCNHKSMVNLTVGKVEP